MNKHLKMMEYDEFEKWAKKTFDWEIDADGTHRFVKKPIMSYLCDKINLNLMWIDFQRENCSFSVEEFQQFYRDIGYSLCGYWEIWHWEVNQDFRENVDAYLKRGARLNDKEVIHSY